LTITSSGAKCDVCGKFILPGFSESVNPFGVEGIDKTLHCDDDCKKIIVEAKGDWKKLPDGPLRTAFAENKCKHPKTVALNEEGHAGIYCVDCNEKLEDGC